MNAPAWLTARPIAHRALHDRAAGRIENSLAAAMAAVVGNFAIECDVQISQDGEAMVFHDHALDRLTGESGPVRDRPAAALAALTLTGGRDRIPTLTAFLGEVAGRVPVVVEIKSRFDSDERLARRTAEVASAYRGPVALKSFDPAIVSLVRGIAPALPRGIVAQSAYEHGEEAKLPAATRHAMANLLHWPETEPDFISWRHRDLPVAATALPRLLRGVPVMTWTIRSAAEQQAVRPHADQIVFEGFSPA